MDVGNINSGGKVYRVPCEFKSLVFESGFDGKADCYPMWKFVALLCFKFWPVLAR